MDGVGLTMVGVRVGAGVGLYCTVGGTVLPMGTAVGIRGLSVLIMVSGTFGCIFVVVVEVVGRGMGFTGTWLGTVFGGEGGI